MKASCNSNALTMPANGSAIGPRGLAATNLAALPPPALSWLDGIVDILFSMATGPAAFVPIGELAGELKMRQASRRFQINLEKF